MPIFTNNKGKLELISEAPFDLERDIQTLVEQNMRAIFGLNFISSEFMLNNLRVDSLGYDEESNSFVIIEYKRDRNFSIIDQGYAYLGLLLNNKAEFTLIYNEKSSSPLKKDKIDWTQSKVIFISPSFTTYQRKAIEFKDLPIELWEVKRYSNNTMLFNQILAPEKSESITKITSSSEIMKSVNKEIVTYSEDYHLAKCDNRIKDIYRELKDSILSISPTITVEPKKNYIAFVNKKNFIYLRTRRSKLSLGLNLKIGELNDPKHIGIDITASGLHTPCDYSVFIDDKSDLGYILTLIRQAYDKN